MIDATLVIDGVDKRFGDLVVLRNIKAVIKRGTITAFIGPNGAGKTTLFHTIAGDVHADNGKILFRGEDINNMPPWRIARMGIGRLFQDVRIFRNLSILENVLLACYDHPGQTLAGSLLRLMNGRNRQAKAEKEAFSLLDQMGVEKPFDRLAATLSWGNQKLLALARMLACDFGLLLLDEPTAGLSAPMIDRFQEIIQRVVRERNVTVGLIEHNIGFVSRIADFTYLMRAGAIYDQGPTQAVLTRPETIEICIGL